MEPNQSRYVAVTGDLEGSIFSITVNGIDDFLRARFSTNFCVQVCVTIFFQNGA